MELMKLKIPGGWGVFDNKFYDTPPEANEDGFILNFHEGFTEDVLWIQEVSTDNRPHDFWSIDMSWLPDSRIEGYYYLKLFWCSKERYEEVEVFETKDRFAACNKIEFWMMDIRLNYNERRQQMLDLFSKKRQ